MIDSNRLRQLAEAYQIQLDSFRLELLDAYAMLLTEWNTRMNLTAIVEPEEIETKHFLDCLLLACQPEIHTDLLDVGSGAGFPGFVVKILRPEVEVTLLEPTGKKTAFLQEIIKKLGISAIIVPFRAEEAAHKVWRETFTAVTARAVASLPTLCEYCLPFVREKGYFLPMKGDASQELEEASNALHILGGTLRRVAEYQLPGGAKRSICCIQKIAPTPPKYPRLGGKPKKTPL